jgi:phosphonate transport system ATP-binding protein
MELLKIDGLTKDYSADCRALDDVQITVGKGEFVSIIGPSGAGKSTLLRCINRMIEASEGNINFDGIDVIGVKKNDLRKLRTKIGMIFQHYNLVERLTVIENTLHGRLGYKSTLQGVLGIYNREEKENAMKALEFLGLSEQVYKRCDQLSGGQKQRVGIARALIQEPKMILCDEPIASLDPNTSKIIMDHLKRICEQMGITCVVNLHQVNVAVKYSDRIIGIRAGKVVYDGSPNLSIEDVQNIYGSEADELILDLDTKKKTIDETVTHKEKIKEGMLNNVTA